MSATSAPREVERYAWLGGAVFVVFLVAEAGISLAVKANQDDSAAKIAGELADHRKTLIVVACLSIVYAVGFVIYLTRLNDLLRRNSIDRRFWESWVLIGGVLFITLHGVSDIGIIGMLGGKVAVYSAQRNQGLAYMLYLLTYALAASAMSSAASLPSQRVSVLATPVLPRWLGWMAILASPFLCFEGFGLGGVIGSFGLVVDLIGFVLLLILVLISSIVLFMRGDAAAQGAAGTA